MEFFFLILFNLVNARSYLVVAPELFRGGVVENISLVFENFFFHLDSMNIPPMSSFLVAEVEIKISNFGIVIYYYNITIRRSDPLIT